MINSIQQVIEDTLLDNEFTTTDSSDFASNLMNVRLKPEYMITLDIKYQYVNIAIEETLSMIETQLKRNNINVGMQ
jgi:hypothetical protein